MDIFHNLKGQVNSLNIILTLLIVGLIVLNRRKRIAGFVLIGASIVTFLLFSTPFIPSSLIANKESKYPYFDAHQSITLGDDSVFVVVLAGGHTSDDRLSPTSQLSSSSLGRLVEGVRLIQTLPKSTLVTCGPPGVDNTGLAHVYKRSAMDLGLSDQRIRVLEGGNTTHQEAMLFRSAFGDRYPVVVVTDACHMERAMNFFESEGMRAAAAPCNFIIKKENAAFGLGFLPSIENLRMMDKVIHEFFGTVKAAII